MRTSALVTRDVNVFIFPENDRFVLKTTTKKTKTKRSFFKSSFFKNGRFKNGCF